MCARVCVRARVPDDSQCESARVHVGARAHVCALMSACMYLVCI